MSKVEKLNDEGSRLRIVCDCGATHEIYENEKEEVQIETMPPKKPKKKNLFGREVEK